MKKKISGLLLLVLIVSMVLGLAACGSSEPAAPATPAAPAADATASEQQKTDLVAKYKLVSERYNELITTINADPALSADQELVASYAKLGEALLQISEIIKTDKDTMSPEGAEVLIKSLDEMNVQLNSK